MLSILHSIRMLPIARFMHMLSTVHLIHMQQFVAVSAAAQGPSGGGGVGPEYNGRRLLWRRPLRNQAVAERPLRW